ncbi:MAG: LuxR C-terminal-related transcriptional regulator [Muribaculaceae bacterium]|nr:LuxR C-terminal-related transcriptional regulator [Muribaculaceae bacterium]
MIIFAVGKLSPIQTVMISVNKDGYSPRHIMRDLLRDNAMLLPALSRFDIPFGFGEASVAEVCRNHNVDCPTFISVCNLLSGYRYERDAISLPALMGYLRRAHTSFLNIELPKIRYNLIEATAGQEDDEVAKLLIKFFDDYVEEVRRHMEYENEVIFTYIDRLLVGEATGEFRISDYSESHSDTVEKLNQLKEMFISQYSRKDNMKLSSALFDIIVCGRDMMSHFEVETQLLIPCVMRIESQLKSGQQGKEKPTETENTAEQLKMLSEREKEIIREVALGKANKEIADSLFISVNTVTTHRRNICAKLDIHTTAGLTVFAIINHLVDLADVKPQ